MCWGADEYLSSTVGLEMEVEVYVKFGGEEG
jgi:hypothetical protein